MYGNHWEKTDVGHYWDLKGKGIRKDARKLQDDYM